MLDIKHKMNNGLRLHLSRANSLSFNTKREKKKSAKSNHQPVLDKPNRFTLLFLWKRWNLWLWSEHVHRMMHHPLVALSIFRPRFLQPKKSGSGKVIYVPLAVIKEAEKDCLHPTTNINSSLMTLLWFYPWHQAKGHSNRLLARVKSMNQK